MKKAISMFGLLAVMLAVFSLASFADEKASTWTGWISDSHCGAKGMSAGHKACAQTCVKTNGASWVFVNSKDQKVIAIKNQDAVKPDEALGHEVTVTGTMNADGSLQVSSIAPAKSS
jgi:hypothetical protein